MKTSIILTNKTINNFKKIINILNKNKQYEINNSYNLSDDVIYEIKTRYSYTSHIFKVKSNLCTLFFRNTYSSIGKYNLTQCEIKTEYSELNVSKEINFKEEIKEVLEILNNIKEVNSFLLHNKLNKKLAVNNTTERKVNKI